MRQSTIARLIGRHLYTELSAADIVWPNDPRTPTAKPYFLFQNVRVGDEDPTLAGGMRVSTGFVILTVVEQLDVFSTTAENLADDARALFPKALRITDITEGSVWVPEPASVVTSYRDGPDYRVPVRIPYVATGYSEAAPPPVPPPAPAGVFTQATPALTWTVNHNLGREVQVSIHTLGGVEILASIVHTTLNQFVVTFNSAQAGKAVYG